MSQVVDNKIVEFELDNRNFEKNADKSLKTIDKLQDGLNFDKATKSLQNMEVAARDINFDSIANSVETIKAKFSAWDVLAINVLNRISDKVMNLAENFIKSVSGIQMMAAGFDKYEDKVTSVQTIMSATASTWEENAKAIGFEGTQMEFVNEQLEKLNQFSDETSFSFTDMTSNIGKFTSSGVDLDKAVTAMEGISVWAAKSGQNAQSASRAYYNLAQAISVGSVKLIDWKSIENANMATMEFKQTAIDTAVQLKYLKKVGDGVYKTTSGNTVTVENFNEALKDEWFSSEVLMASLEKYGKAAAKFSDIYNEYGATSTDFLYNMDKWNEGQKTIEEVSEDLGISVEELLPLFEELNSEEYKLGLSAYRAAQEAKTWNDVLEATKDAVSTGWMKTFELIFGNYEEAKVLWTEMANRLWYVFAAGGEARNEVLALWKAAGGQKALVDAFWDLWDAIEEFAKIIKKAFEEIFEPNVWKAAGKLDAFTTKFKKFAASLHMTEETAENFKRVFKGLFAAVDIVKDALQVITIPLKNVIKYLASGSDTVLGYAASIGDWIVALRDMLKESKFFENVGQNISNAIFVIIDEIRYFKDLVVGAFDNTKSGLENAVSIITAILSYFVESVGYLFTKLTGIDVSTYIQAITDSIKAFGDKVLSFASTLNFDPILNKVKDFIKGIKDEFKKFGKIDTSGIEELGSKVRESFHPLLFVADVIKAVFNGIAELLKTLSPIFKAVGTLFKAAFSEIAEGLGALVDNFSFEKVEELVKSGVLTAIGVAIYSFIQKLKDGADVFSSAKDVLGKIGGVLDGVKDSFAAWQNELKSNTLLKLAAAIGIITVSLIALSTIEEDKLVKAMSIITAEFIDLIGSMKALSTLDLAGLSKFSGAMITIGIAVLLFSSAIKKLSTLDYQELIRGLVGIAAVMFMLTKSVSALAANSGKTVKGAGSMILMALAINLLVKPVKELSSMEWGPMLKGLAGVLILLEGMSLFMKEGMQGSVKAGAAMILMAVAVNILAKAVKSFAEMDFVEMVKGLSAFALVLFGMSKFMQAISGVKKMIPAAIGMTIIAASMLIFAEAIKRMGELKIEEIGKGLLGMAGALAAVTVAMNFMPKGMVTKGVGLLLVAAALNVLAGALKEFANFSWEQIGKGLVTLGGALLIVTAALNFMKGTLGASAALLVFAAAMAILTPCLKSLGDMKLEEIGKSLLMLFGTFLVLGVAGYALAPVTTVILGLAAAIGILGVGMMLLGGGVALLAAGLAALGGGALVGVKALIEIIESIIQMIPDVIKAVGEGLFDILLMLANRADELARALGKLIVTLVEAILDTLDKLTPKIVRFLTNTLVELVSAAIVTLKNLIPKLFEFLVFLLDQLATYIPQLINGLFDVIIAEIETFGERIPDLINTGIQFIIQLINGLAQGIIDNAEPFRDALVNLFESAWTAVLVMFGFDKDEAKEMVETAVNLIKSFIKGVVKMGTDLLNGFVELFVIVVEYFDAMFKKFKDFGINLIQGLIDGVLEMADKAVSTVTGVAEAIGNGFADFFGINSPSKLFEQYGEYLDEGLMKGINNLSGDVGDTTKKLGVVMNSGLQDSLKSLVNTMNTEEYSPKIVPVLDFDSMNTKARSIGDVISDRALDINSFNTRSMNANLEARFSSKGLDSLDTDIVSAIKELQTDTQMLGTYISGMQLTLDGKAVVGGIAPAMNIKLGQYVKRSGRGN